MSTQTHPHFFALSLRHTCTENKTSQYIAIRTKAHWDKAYLTLFGTKKKSRRSVDKRLMIKK